MFSADLLLNFLKLTHAHSLAEKKLPSVFPKESAEKDVRKCFDFFLQLRESWFRLTRGCSSSSSSGAQIREGISFFLFWYFFRQFLISRKKSLSSSSFSCSANNNRLLVHSHHLAVDTGKYNTFFVNTNIFFFDIFFLHSRTLSNSFEIFYNTLKVQRWKWLGYIFLKLYVYIN